MADEDGASPQSDKRHEAHVRMELRDSLPGGRALIGVEQEDEFVWLASREHVTKQAVDEFIDQLDQIVTKGWWGQNWPGR